MFLKSNGNQLTSVDIGPEFANLTKIKHIWHVFHSILGPEFEFEDKNNNFPKHFIYVKLLGFDENWKCCLILEKIYFCLQIQAQGLKLSGKHASYV